MGLKQHDILIKCEQYPCVSKDDIGGSNITVPIVDNDTRIGRRAVTCSLLTFLALLSLPFTAQAEDWIKPGNETLKFGLGAFLQAFDTSMRVDNQNLGVGGDIDLENDLGLTEDDTILWTNLVWRFADKHRLGISYFDFTRDATATALRDLEIGDEIYPVGASLNTNFRARTAPFYYAYSFIKKEKHELAGSVGFHWFEISLDIEGSASSAPIGDADANVSASAAAPLPLLGIRYDYHANPRWTTSVHGEIFSLDLTDDTLSFSGTVYNVRLSTEYWFMNNFGAGAAINLFDLNAEIDDPNWQGGIDYRYFGPQIYIQARI